MIDPFFGQLAGAAGNMLGSALRGAPAAPSSVNPWTDIGIDFSAWTVATGGSKATATNDKTEAPAAVPGRGVDWVTLGGMLLVAVVALRWINKN